MKEKTVTIAVNIGSQNPFFYKGKIESEKDGFLEFNDRKLGKISINKDAVISIMHDDNGGSR